MTWDEVFGRALTMLSCPGDYPEGRLTFPLEAAIPVGDGPVKLAVSIDRARLQFSYALAEGVWRDVGPVLDASLLSDEAGGGEHRAFTGAFVGMFAFDTSGSAAPADFRYYEYDGADEP